MYMPGINDSRSVPSWMLATTGVIAILFGLAALIWPDITLFVLILLFGIQVLVVGLVEFLAMFRALSEHQTWWTHLVIAILNVGVAVYIFAYPAMTAVLLLYVFAFWAIILGIVEIVRGVSTGEPIELVVGALTIVVGLVVLSNPFAGLLAYIVLVGVFAIVRGAILLYGSYRVSTATPTSTI
jgi:uncharacterized membrane protein HdeD (DUF308 family)